MSHPFFVGHAKDDRPTVDIKGQHNEGIMELALDLLGYKDYRGFSRDRDDEHDTCVIPTSSSVDAFSLRGFLGADASTV